MDTRPIQIFTASNDSKFCVFLDELLEKIDQPEYYLECETKHETALNKIIANQHDIYIIDDSINHGKALDIIFDAISLGNRKPILLLTDEYDVEQDRIAMQAGVSDVIVKKQLDENLLERVLRYTLERNNIYNALVSKERQFKSLFEQSIDPIYLVDMKGKFVDANNSFLELLQIHKNKLKNLTLPDIFRDKSVGANVVEQIRNREKINSLEAEFINSNNSKIIGIFTASPLKNHEGKITGYQGIIHDITARKRAEKQLKTTEKITMTGRLARAMGHEVRNPLTNISLSREQLQELYEDDEEAMIYLEIIERNTQRIDELITNLLKSSKPFEIKPSKTNFSRLIDQTLDQAKDRIHLLDITLSKSYNHDFQEINVDSEKISMALLNIINNALEVIEEKSGKINISTMGLNGDAIIQIEDNGPGIKKEYLDKLFDPFFSAKENGTGLGLTTVQNIVTAHGGSVEVESEVGKGTKFIVTLHNS